MQFAVGIFRRKPEPKRDESTGSIRSFNLECKRTLPGSQPDGYLKRMYCKIMAWFVPPYLQARLVMTALLVGVYFELVWFLASTMWGIWTHGNVCEHVEAFLRVTRERLRYLSRTLAAMTDTVVNSRHDYM